MANPTNGNSNSGSNLLRDNIGVVIILIVLVVMIFMRAQAIKSESAEVRNGTVEVAK